MAPKQPALYISGLITDGGKIKSPIVIKERLEVFNRVGVRLGEAGYHVLNPARHQIEGGEWQDYMRLALRDISNCTGIATIPGWEESAGARAEVAIAASIGLDAALWTRWIS